MEVKKKKANGAGVTPGGVVFEIVDGGNAVDTAVPIA